MTAMGYNIEEACNGCAECVHCQLAGEKYKVFHCDSCGNDLDVSELRRYNGDDICRDCFLEMMDEQWSSLPRVKED